MKKRFLDWILPRQPYRELFPLRADVLSGREKDGFTYPVAVYDHNEKRAVTDGFCVSRKDCCAPRTFVFGDIQNGRLFAGGLAEIKKSG